MCDPYGDDGPSAYSETWRKARKPHRCCACYETIPAGHRYHYTSGIWDGHAQSFKHCARCRRIFEALIAKTPRGTVDLLLDCGETWREAFGAEPTEEIAELAFVTPAEMQARVAPTPEDT